MKWLAACSAAFGVIYVGCIEITRRRTDVGTWYADWELQIPFVPWMIVPYWSIDLFFLGSFFVCDSRAELRTLGRRILTAIAVCGACFLALPLKLGFPRPEVDGIPGALFGALRAFDAPFNLFPSLHIALRVILGATYARHTRGPLRRFLQVWFSLIGISTVLVWQHHLIDVAGGFVLGAVCFYAWREEPQAAPAGAHPRLALLYALGALITLPLVWPPVALALVAAGYAGLGPAVYRKEGGRLAAPFLLAPALLGQHLSLAWYRRQCRPWDEAAPGVWIGRVLNEREADEAVRRGVTAVLDLTAEFSEAEPFRRVAYLNLPVLDLTAPTPEQVRAGVAFITEHARTGVVYVHCKIGYSRSAAMVGRWMMASGLVRTAEEAVERMRAARPSLVVRPETWATLRSPL